MKLIYYNLIMENNLKEVLINKKASVITRQSMLVYPFSFIYLSFAEESHAWQDGQVSTCYLLGH